MESTVGQDGKKASHLPPGWPAIPAQASELTHFYKLMAAFFFWDKGGGLTLPWNQLKGVPREPLSLMFSCFNKDWISFYTWLRNCWVHVLTWCHLLREILDKCSGKLRAWGSFPGRPSLDLGKMWKMWGVFLQVPKAWWIRNIMMEVHVGRFLNAESPVV